MKVGQVQNSKHTRSKIAGRWLLFWTLFIGIRAVLGSSGMLLDPSGKAMGMDAMLPYFQVLPLADRLFQDFIFSGIALLIVNGLTNLTAAVLALTGAALCLLRNEWDWLFALFGLGLIAIAAIQNGRKGENLGNKNEGWPVLATPQTVL